MPLTQAQQRALQTPQSIGVSSPEFAPGKQIPREYTGYGDDVSPPLQWSGVPHEAQALAVVVEDLDRPFTHWTVWNLPPRIEGVERGVDPLPMGGVEGQNDFGTVGWRGPKPPEGSAHRYAFRVIALDKFLDLPPNVRADEVWRHLAIHAIAWGEMTGTVSRT